MPANKMMASVTNHNLMRNSRKNILAVIITYNPDKEVLWRNIEALYKQVDSLLVIDNCSKNAKCIERILNQYPTARLIKNKKNFGLPANYNRAARLAAEEGYNWLLIMDQDSVVPEDMIPLYFKCAEDLNPGIITSCFWDINQDPQKKELFDSTPKEMYTQVERCYGSASMNRVDMIRDVGYYDERLFIDFADYDFCRRVKNKGYKIVRVNDCIVEHQLGHATFKKFLGKQLKLRNYPPIRYYYIVRNLVYLSRKYRSVLKLLDAFKTFFIISFKVRYENETKEKRKLLRSGLYDGFRL